jgi:hypothetical protein
MTNKLTARQKDKLVEAARTAIVFTVKGLGQFPLDMLRYDNAWPNSEADSSLMQAEDLGRLAHREITLRSLTGPTAARWSSFGWEVTEVSS